MQEYNKALEAFDVACKTIKLPCTVTDLRKFCQGTFEALRISEEITANFVLMLQDQNYQAATEEFKLLMRIQFEQWRQIFGRERRISICLKSFKEEQWMRFGLDKRFVERAIEFFEEPDVPNKITLITRFIVHLGQAFLMAGDYYLKRYELSKEWREQNGTVISQMSDMLVECYRSYCYFYHPKIEEEIRNKLHELPSISNLMDHFRQNLRNTVHIFDSNTDIIMREEAPNANSQRFRKAYSRINNNVFETRVKRFKELYDQFKNIGDPFGHLNAQQKQTLAFILVDTLEKMPFSKLQKEEVSKLISQQNLGFKPIGRFEQVSKIAWAEPLIQNTLCRLYWLCRNNYTSAVRQYLRFVFRRLGDLNFQYSNFRVLVLLENRRIAPSALLDQLRGTHNLVGEPIKQMLQKIKGEVKDLKNEPVPFMTFQRMGRRFTPSRVVTIFISGFSCQSSAREENWKVLLHHGQTYSMNWQSSSKSDTLTFLFGFNGVKKIAIRTGKYLAYLIRQQMKGYLINFVGFSLGTELIRVTLAHMEEDIGMINRLILLGGAASCRDYANFLRDYPIDTINCYNAKDYVLKMFLPLFDGGVKPCGLNFIDAPFVTNINTESFAKPMGHQIAFEELRKIVEFENDVLYLNEQKADQQPPKKR